MSSRLGNPPGNTLGNPLGNPPRSPLTSPQSSPPTSPREHQDQRAGDGRCESRREFLRVLGGGALALALGGLGACDPLRRKDRLNIVFILTDDHRHDAMGCAGHPWHPTPQLDRLAGEGVRFTNAFATTSLCSPSRASFLTGCYAHRHGVVTNEANDPPPDLPTFPLLLQRAGYETAFIGKWHQARWATPRPGFDHWEAFNRQGEYNRNTMNVDGRWEPSRNYVTDDLTDRALRFLERPHRGPFLLFLSHKAVHEPPLPAPRHASLFQDLEVHPLTDRDDDLRTKPDWGDRKTDEGEARERYMRDYMRCLVAVDEGVGRIVDTLRWQGILDRTLIVYASDNGCLHGEHGLWDKRVAYEPSIRIPLIMRHPRLAQGGKTCGALALNIDLAPTLLEAAGLPISPTFQGRSLLGALRGEPGRSSFGYEYFAEEGRVPTTLALRTRRWKYVTYPRPPTRPPDQPWFGDELYDLQADPNELQNLVVSPDSRPLLAQLWEELQSWRQETGFVMPAGQSG